MLKTLGNLRINAMLCWVNFVDKGMDTLKFYAKDEQEVVDFANGVKASLRVTTDVLNSQKDTGLWAMDRARLIVLKGTVKYYNSMIKGELLPLGDDVELHMDFLNKKIQEATA